MANENIGYHTRLDSDNTVKVVGGSFGGTMSRETAERLVKAHFTVRIKPSGTAVFVDRQGRDVRLYLGVDAAKTEAGIAAMQAWRQEKQRAEQAQREQEDAQQVEIEGLMNGMPHDEIVRRLKGGTL